jgi:hypothetical protein
MEALERLPMALRFLDRWLLRALLAGAALAVSAAGSAAPEAVAGSSRVPMPAIETPAGERCVEDTAFMRRNHMELLKHQRVRTVHEGIRTVRHSLTNCVTCHAGKKTGSVTGDDGFCESCHRYASVKLDCFECHADRPATVAGARP